MVKNVENPISPEPSFVFRADDNYKIGDPVGLELHSQNALQADIQNPLQHVLDKKAGDTSI